MNFNIRQAYKGFKEQLTPWIIRQQ